MALFTSTEMRKMRATPTLDLAVKSGNLRGYTEKGNKVEIRFPGITTRVLNWDEAYGVSLGLAAAEDARKHANRQESPPPISPGPDFRHPGAWRSASRATTRTSSRAKRRAGYR